MGIVLSYKGERDTIKALAPDAQTGLEFWISNKMRELRDRAEGVKRTLGVLAGHDEVRLSDTTLIPRQLGTPSLQGILAQYFPTYRFVDVDLKSDVDPTLDGVLLLQPGKDLLPDELRRLDAFVLRGKALAVVASAVNLKAGDASSLATLSTHGLGALLAGYGIEMHEDVVVDFGAHFSTQVFTQAGPQTVRFPSVPLLGAAQGDRDETRSTTLDTSFPSFFRIPEVAFPFASSLDVHRERQPAAKLRVLATSSARSEVRKGPVVPLPFLQRWAPQGSALGPRIVAASAEGRLRSAFGSASGSAPSRVLVVASSQFFANPFARAGEAVDHPGYLLPPAGDETLEMLAAAYAQATVTNQILVAKNTLDWMIGEEELLASAAKLLPSAACKNAKPARQP